MPQDECRDCERVVPDGKGLTDGLCDKCRAAREEAGYATDADVPPEEDGGGEPEPDEPPE